MLDIPALSRPARQGPQHKKFANLFLREPLGPLSDNMLLENDGFRCQCSGFSVAAG
jgi:hypothetical protein